jgi:hypothetical protein
MKETGLFRLAKRGTRPAERESSASRRASRRLAPAVLDTLESRLLLASVTFSSIVPVQRTDYTQALSLPKFDPSLGTLTEVDLSWSVSGTENGSLTNTAPVTESFNFAEDVNLALLNGTTSLLAPDLNTSQAFTDLAAGASGIYGPFSPTASATASYTTGPNFDLFSTGTGNVDLTVTTLTTQTTLGGGGNIVSNIATFAGGTATVTYQYTPQPVTISGNVYEDKLGTGALAPGDPPIPGTLLTLTNSLGAVVATTTTGLDGTYAFTATPTGSPLLPGTYTVTETQPAGFLQGTNTVGTVNGVTDGVLIPVDMIGSIVLTSGQNSINNNFGEVLPVTISGNVYEDQFGLGFLAPGDPPLGGVVLTLTNAQGAVVAATMTGSTGTYAFTTTATGAPLPPGIYMVTEIQPAGFLQGTNTVGTVNGVTDGVLNPVDMIGSIVLTSGQNSINNNFGEVLPVTISGNVYVDQAGLGFLAPGDPPIPGVVLILTNASGTVVDTTMTGSTGAYAFTTTATGAPLAPGTYTVSEVQPAGFLQGTNTVGTVNGIPDGVLVPVDMIGSIKLTSAQNSVGNNFGELLPAAPLLITNVLRFGVHHQQTLLVMTFSAPLNPASAMDLANYEVLGPNLHSRLPNQVPIASATYDPATLSVTLRFIGRLNIHQSYLLLVSNVISSAGAVLEGSDGRPGDVFATTVNKSTLSGFYDHFGTFVPIDHGVLYPAAFNAAYHGGHFPPNDNPGPFAALDRTLYLAATSETPTNHAKRAVVHVSKAAVPHVEATHRRK